MIAANSSSGAKRADFSAFTHADWVDFFARIKKNWRTPFSSETAHPYMVVGPEFVYALRHSGGPYASALKHSSATAVDDGYVYGKLPGKIVGITIYVDLRLLPDRYMCGMRTPTTEEVFPDFVAPIGPAIMDLLAMGDLRKAADEELRFALALVVLRAKELGKVVTVTCVPNKPLAIGNYNMVPSIRDAC